MSNIFRDPTEGATARRADLLRRRRDELVMMPHAIRRVYIARRARTAASLSIALIGTAMIAIAATPAWAQFLARGLPGINPAVLCTAIVAMWIVGLFTYFAARAIDEHRFAVAMSRYVMPGKDVNEDVERLSHEKPDQVARDMAHRLEVRSAALPVLAAGVLLPVTALYLGAAYRAGGWPVIAEFEGAVALHANKLLVCGGIGTALAIVMTKRAARLPIAAPMMMGVALFTAAGSVVASLWLVPIAMIAATVAMVVRRLRIERDLLQAEDPAAGSEIFTIRGFIRQVRESGAAVIARVKQIRARRVLVGAGIAAAALGGVLMMMPSKPTKLAATPASAQVRITPGPITMSTPSGSKSMVEAMGGGRLKITIDIHDDKPVDLPALAGMAYVPATWSATIKLEQLEGLSLQVGAFGAPTLQELSIGSTISVTRASCGVTADPLALRIKGEPGHYVLYAEPTLTPAGC